MSRSDGPEAPPQPPADLATRKLHIDLLRLDVILSRIHRSRHPPLHFGRDPDPAARQRWDSPDASYGVCYLAEESHIAFAETLLRDLSLDAISEAQLRIRSLSRVRVRAPLRLVAMHGKALRGHGADASVVQGPYSTTWEWSAALHAHPDAPDGICYRARHDDSGISIALFERAREKVEEMGSIELLDPSFAQKLARWHERYEMALTS